MITILGKTYLTDKEAAQRYGYSRSWFQNQRCKKKLPKYVKVNGNGNGNGKILYPLDETDRFFHESLKVCE